MSTYTDPYVFGRISGAATNTAGTRRTQMNKIKNWFVEAGWDAYQSPGSIIVETDGVMPFSLCLLGSGQDVFYGYKLDSEPAPKFMLVDEDYGNCCEDPVGGDEFYLGVILDTQIDGEGYHVINDANNPGVVASINQNEIYTDCSALGLAVSTNSNVAPGPFLTDAQELNKVCAYIVSILVSSVTGIKCIRYPTEPNGSGGYRTEIGYFGSQDLADIQVNLGNQLNTSVTFNEGPGWLLVGGASGEDDNYMEMLLYYETAQPTSINVSNQIRFATRVGGDRFSDEVQKTPIRVLSEEAGINSTVNNPGGLTAVDDIEGFISPTCFFLDQPDLGLALNCVAWGGAFRLKNLEAEVGDPNITKAIWLAATLQRISHARDNFRDTCNAQCNCAFWVEGVGITGGHGTGIYNIAHAAFSNTRSVTTQRDGIMWYGSSVAPICEPWIGWNPIALSGALTTPAAIFCQIPDCIIVHRSLDLGFPPSPEDEVFTWDGKLWRYFQVDRFPETGTFDGPGSSMAFRVKDSRVYNGSSYSGLEMYELDSIDTPGTVTNGDTNGLSVIAAVTQDLSNGGQCIIRSNNERVQFADHLLEFAPGENNADTTFTEVGLGVTETIQLQAIGKDDQIVVENIVASA